MEEKRMLDNEKTEPFKESQNFKNMRNLALFFLAMEIVFLALGM